MPLFSSTDRLARRARAQAYTRLFESLEDRNLLSSAPIGKVTITDGEISGFAYDKDDPTAALSVRIDVNGTTLQTITADQANLNAPSTVPPHHGFDLNGTFSGVIDVYAIDVPSGDAVLLKSTNIAPKGAVTKVTPSLITGYVYDLNDPAAAVHVKVLVDGTVAAEADASIDDPAIAKRTQGSGTAHAFSIPLTLPPGKHKVQVVAVDPNSSSLPNGVVLKAASLTNPLPVGGAPVVTNSQITGFATDPDSASTALTIKIKIDGTVVTTVTADQARPTGVKGGGRGSAGSHWFSYTPTGLSAGPHLVEIIATDVSSGQDVTVFSGTTPNQKPKGVIETANPDQVVGYAWDPDSPDTPVQLILVMDKSRYVIDPTVDQTSVSRPDISILPSPDHGFIINTPTSLFGNHTLKLIALDTTSGAETVVATKTFKNNAPKGKVEQFTATGATGYMFDPDKPTTSINVLVQIDPPSGQSLQQAANISRPELVTKKILVNAEHGFSVTWGTLAPGKHTVKIFGVDPDTGVASLIGTKTFKVA